MTEETKAVYNEIPLEDAIVTAFALALREAVRKGQITEEQGKEIYTQAADFSDALLSGAILQLHGTDPVEIVPYEKREDITDKSDNLIIGG